MEDLLALRQLSNYAASSEMPALVQWARGEAGHVLVTKSRKQLFVGVAVVKASEFKLNCGANGNFIDRNKGSLKNAKYQFFGEKPDDLVFAEDYEKLYKNLARVQAMIASTSLRYDLLHSDPTGNLVRFARAVFEKRSQAVSDSPREVYYEDVVDPAKAALLPKKESVDEETKNWPIGEDYKDDLAELAPTHRAVPLRVYRNDTFVEPSEVNDELANALVEVHFTLHHIHFGKHTPPHDNYRANIEQVVIHRTGGKVTAGYSSDIRSGPIRASAVASKRPASPAEPSSSRSKVAKTLSVQSASTASHTAESSSSKGKERAVEYDDENA